MTLAWAPAATIAGAVSLDPSATIVERATDLRDARPVEASRRRVSVRRDEKLCPASGRSGSPHASSKENRDYVMALQQQGAPLRAS